jgi:sugar phosphate isomerase/epimerase
MLRRRFLQMAPVATLATAPAYTGPASGPPAGIRLGFDTYSIRAFRWKAIQLLDYAASLKLDAIQLSGPRDCESLAPAHLARVKDHATRLGIAIDGAIGCICPTSSSWNLKTGDPAEYIVKGLRTTRAVGATVMRCYMGNGADRLGSRPIEAHIETTVKILRSVRSQALDIGVKIAVENHSGDMQAGELKTLIEAAGKDFVGACLDSGNPIWAVEDPLFTLEILGPYVLTTHIRDSVVYEHPRGAAAQWVALGDGSIDFRRFIERYRELCPKAAMQLEIITGRPPRVLPYLEPDFWKAFPKANAAEFARFVALAKRGHPFMGTMVIAGRGQQPPEIRAALKQQQRIDLERSLEYAKRALNVGIRWRS